MEPLHEHMTYNTLKIFRYLHVIQLDMNTVVGEFLAFPSRETNDGITGDSKSFCGFNSLHNVGRVYTTRKYQK